MDLKENSSFHWSNLCPTLFSLQKLSNDSNSSRLWYQSVTRKFQFWLWSNVYINKKTPRSPMNFSTQLRPDLYVKNIYNRLSHLTTNRKRRDKGKKSQPRGKGLSIPLSLSHYPSRRHVRERPTEHLSWCVGFLRCLASLVGRLVAWVSWVVVRQRLLKR